MVGLLWGIFVGLVIGGGTSALAAFGLHLPLTEPMSGLWAYLFAVVSGVLVGLFAGKPIWAKGARIEAGLKAAFGALLAAGLMFALRKWVSLAFDLTSFGLGKGAVGTSPVLSFPIVATVMALLFEVDNMFGSDDKSGEPGKKRVASPKARVAELADAEEESAPSVQKSKEKR